MPGNVQHLLSTFQRIAGMGHRVGFVGSLEHVSEMGRLDPQGRVAFEATLRST
jgi:hypothetical protein